MRISILLLIVTLSAMLVSCGPLGPVPGGALNGELASDTPSDWSFSKAHKTIQLEVRPSEEVGRMRLRPLVFPAKRLEVV